MKQSLAILLTLCLLINMSGYHFFFRLYRQMVKKEMKAYIRTHRNEFSLVKYEIALKDGAPADERFYWENDHEFRFEGNMYDVVDKQVSGHTLTVLCINDKKETALIQHYEQIMKQSRNHTSKNRAASTLSQLLHSLYIQDYNIFELQAPLHPAQYRSCITAHLPQVFLEIQTPPPQSARDHSII